MPKITYKIQVWGISISPCLQCNDSSFQGCLFYFFVEWSGGYGGSVLYFGPHNKSYKKCRTLSTLYFISLPTKAKSTPGMLCNSCVCFKMYYDALFFKVIDYGITDLGSGTSHSMACKTLDSATYAFKIIYLIYMLLKDQTLQTIHICLSLYPPLYERVKCMAYVGLKGLNPDVGTGCCGYTEWGQSLTLPLSLSSAELSGGARQTHMLNNEIFGLD